MRGRVFVGPGTARLMASVSDKQKKTPEDERPQAPGLNYDRNAIKHAVKFIG
jgi:hypothetical protein